MNIKLLNEQNLEFLSLKEGFTGSSESIHVKMAHCWKSHVTAYLYISVNIYLCIQVIDHLNVRPVTKDFHPNVALHYT